MTTVVPFVPSTAAAFSFQATLDGGSYNAVVTWSLFGQRYYLNLTAADGTPILTTALVGSPSAMQLQALTWEAGSVTAETLNPHGYTIGTVVALTVAGVAPSAYNGAVDALIVSENEFTYPLASDPGMATVFGQVSYGLNLIGGVPDVNGDYFSSTMVFRQQAQQFEINP